MDVMTFPEKTNLRLHAVESALQELQSRLAVLEGTPRPPNAAMLSWRDGQLQDTPCTLTTMRASTVDHALDVLRVGGIAFVKLADVELVRRHLAA